MRYGRTFPAKPIIGRLTLVILTSPLAPTNFAATASNGSTTISLSWTNNASPLTNTRVEVSSDGVSGWAEIANSPVASPGASTTHAVGSNSVTRYYRARSYDSISGLYSGYTAVVSATTAPTAPTIGAVTATNDSNNLTVAFTDNSSDETTFSIEASANGVSGFSEVATSATSPYVHNVGARDTTRYYRVRAYRSSDGIYSGYSSVSTAATTAPANPSAIVVTEGTTTASVAFTDNSTSETTFKVERKTGAGGAYSEIGSTATSPYADTGLSAETLYYWKVRAYRASDGIYSGYASEVSATTGVTAPSNLVAGCVDETTAAAKVRLYWDINATTENGTRIQRSTDQSSWSTVTTTAAGVHTYTDTGLAANTTYYYRVASVSSGGSFSDQATATVKTNTSTVGSLNLAFLQKTRNLPPS